MEELMEIMAEIKAKMEHIVSRQDELEKGKVFAVADEVKKLNEDLVAQQKSLNEVLEKIQLMNLSGSPTQNKAEEVKQFAAFARGKMNDLLRTNSDSDGGYLCPPEIEAEITHLANDSSVIRSLADVRQTQRNEVRMHIRVEGSDAAWVGEDEKRKETKTPKYEDVSIPLHTVYANPSITTAVLEDADADVTAEVVNAIGESVGDKESEAFIIGDGVKKPRGILSYDFQLITKRSDFKWGKTIAVKTGTENGLNTADPIKAFDLAKYLVHAKYRKGAVWIMNSDTLTILDGLRDNNGLPLVTQNFKDDTPTRFRGYGIEVDEFMPSIDSGKPFVIFGNIHDAYAIRDRKGLTMIRNPYSEPGFITFPTEKRVGGGVKNFQAYSVILAKA